MGAVERWGCFRSKCEACTVRGDVWRLADSLQICKTSLTFNSHCFSLGTKHTRNEMTQE